MMNCPNCGFDPEPNIVIHTLMNDKFFLSEVGAKLTASALKALLVADEDAYAEYNNMVAEIEGELGEQGAELALYESDIPGEELIPGDSSLGHLDDFLEEQAPGYFENREAHYREGARARVTQAATEVSNELAIAVAIGFAASEVLKQQSSGEFRVLSAVFSEFLASATAAIEAAHSNYKDTRRQRFYNPQDIGDDDLLPF